MRNRISSSPERVVPYPERGIDPSPAREKDLSKHSDLAGSIIKLYKTTTKKTGVDDMGEDHDRVEALVRSMVHSDAKRKKDGPKVRFSEPISLEDVSPPNRKNTN